MPRSSILRARAVARLTMVARNKAADPVRSYPVRGTPAPVEWDEEIADTGPSPLRSTETVDRGRTIWLASLDRAKGTVPMVP